MFAQPCSEGKSKWFLSCCGLMEKLALMIGGKNITSDESNNTMCKTKNME